VRHLFYLGSLPSSLAKFAASRSLTTTLFCSRSGIKRLMRSGSEPLLRRLIHSYLGTVYRVSAAKAKQPGLNVVYIEEDLDILRSLSDGRHGKAICLIRDEFNFFHYILLRKDGDCLVVMDPAYGTNTSFKEDVFYRQLGKTMIGYHVLFHA
jgi:hypothetical protein